MSGPHTYYAREHTGWGNRISVSDWKSGRISGHLVRTPRVGDRIVFDMQSGREQATVVTSVEPQFDPPDMFFAMVQIEDEPVSAPMPKGGGYELLQKVASGAALTVAEFRDLGERLGLAPEQIGAAALTFAPIPTAAARSERECIETAVDVLIGSAHIVGLHTDGPNGAPRADLDDMKRRKRELMELIDAWLTKPTPAKES